jgi:hypothetical protein
VAVAGRAVGVALPGGVGVALGLVAVGVALGLPAVGVAVGPAPGATVTVTAGRGGSARAPGAVASTPTAKDVTPNAPVTAQAVAAFDSVMALLSSLSG